MSGIYYEVKEEIEKRAALLEITDHNEINEMINERIQERSIEMFRSIIETLSMTGGSGDAVKSGLQEAIRTTHRYTQGEFWSAMLKVIKAYGDSEYHDPRNKFAVDMCKRMAMAGEDPRTEEVLNKYVEDRGY